MSTATTALHREEAEVRNHGKRTGKKENGKKETRKQTREGEKQ